MPDFVHGAVLQQHLNDVEAHFDLRISEQVQIIKAGSRKPLASDVINRRGGARPLLGRTRFDFHENEAIVVAKNQVNFPAR